MPLFDAKKVKALEKDAKSKAEHKPAILLVDDESENLYVLEELLKDDYKVYSTSSPSDALNIMEYTTIDLIITDQRMPEMTGVEFLSQTIEDYPDCIRIILTGFSDIEATIDAINTGQVYKYMTKPLDGEDLKITLKRAFEKKLLDKKFDLLLEDLRIKNSELNELNLKLDQKLKTNDLKYVNIINKLFPQHVTEALIEGDHSKLKNERVNLTMVYGNFQNFNKLNEDMISEEFFDLLNEYLLIITNMNSKYNGTLDRFFGDNFIIYFDPAEHEDHAFKAVQMATELLTKTKDLSLNWHDMANIDPLILSIGINTGYVNAGVWISNEKYIYTIIGSQVNLARILSETDSDTSQIVIGPKTYNLIKDKVETGIIDEITSKSLKSPVKAHRLKNIKL